MSHNMALRDFSVNAFTVFNSAGLTQTQFVIVTVTSCRKASPTSVKEYSLKIRANLSPKIYL